MDTPPEPSCDERNVRIWAEIILIATRLSFVIVGFFVVAFLLVCAAEYAKDHKIVMKTVGVAAFLGLTTIGYFWSSCKLK
jgi:uncharacterized membrane protein